MSHMMLLSRFLSLLTVSPGRFGGTTFPSDSFPFRAHPTCMLLAFLLLQGCDQSAEEEFVGRIRFIRRVPIGDERRPPELSHGVVTISKGSRINPFVHGGSVAIRVEGGPVPCVGQESLVIKGPVHDVLLALANEGMHDAVARIDGCDWMLTRGSIPGTIEVLRNLRRVAVLRVGEVPDACRTQGPIATTMN